MRRGRYECEDDWDEPYMGARTCAAGQNSTGVACSVHAGVCCTGPRNFTQQRPCVHTSGYQFEVAMGLSVFLGLLGVDRCYLGYPTLGFIKAATCGGFFVGAVVDAVLIAMQVLKPADGSDYDFHSSIPRVVRLHPLNASGQ
eukprot:m51a1_g10829 hypothetical protein (142) ;mRNA; r:31885-32402